MFFLIIHALFLSHSSISSKNTISFPFPFPKPLRSFIAPPNCNQTLLIGDPNPNPIVGSNCSIPFLRASERSRHRSCAVSQRLHLSFSHITPTPNLIIQTLNLSPQAGCAILGFYQWLPSNPQFTHTDDTLSYFVDYFGHRKDFKATHDLLSAAATIAGPKSLTSAINRLVRAGWPSQAVQFFNRMEKDYGLKRDRNSLKVVVEKLCLKGFASYAERMVTDLAPEFFPDEATCDLLIKGWCVNGKLDEAQGLASEMYRGGFELGVGSYNAMLDCVCRLCCDKNPFLLHLEAKKVLVEMEYRGVLRNVETFNVLISNFCKIRKTEDAKRVKDKYAGQKV